jgi:hypothetical protein
MQLWHLTHSRPAVQGPTTSAHLVHIEAHHLKRPCGPELLVHLLVYLHVTWAAGSSSSRGISRCSAMCAEAWQALHICQG